MDSDCLFYKLLAAPCLSFNARPRNPSRFSTKLPDCCGCAFFGKQRRACGKVIQKLQQFARRMIRKFGLLNELNHLKTRFGCRGGQLRAEEFRFSQGYLGRTLKERSFCRSAGSCPRIELFWIKGSVSDPSRTRPVLASPARQTHRRCLGLHP